MSNINDFWLENKEDQFNSAIDAFDWILSTHVIQAVQSLYPKVAEDMRQTLNHEMSKV